ncbi:MAG: glycogen/starch synthase [Acidilobaceae archaeon]
MVLYAPLEVKTIWILTFEYSGVASLGGLGEAVRTRAESLAKTGLNVTVFMPSHGRHANPEIRERLGLRDTGFKECGFRRGLDGRFYRYCLGAEETTINKVRLILFKGLDGSTKTSFDLWDVYFNVEEKASLFARAIKAFTERSQLPDLVEVNDWHSVLAGVVVKELAERRGVALPLLFTIHLSGSPSFPWHYASRDWSGLEEVPHLVWRPYSHICRTYKDVWDEHGGSVEAFGVVEADAIATVSYSYLREELTRKYGSWLELKACVAYNSTDVRAEEVDEYLKSRYGEKSERTLQRLLESIASQSSMWGWLDSVENLVVALGRLTWQKGFDIAVRALDHAPSVRLVILGLPVGDTAFESYLRLLVEERRGRVTAVVGRVKREDALALVRLSKALVVPSRWEPFGLVAIEAQALGVPVVAASVGGLKEVVLDLRWSDEGTGVLTRPEDPIETGLALESLIRLSRRTPPEEIPLVELRRFAKLGFEKIRENCLKRVETLFRESSVVQQIRGCYELARTMAYYRAVASGVTQCT